MSSQDAPAATADQPATAPVTAHAPTDALLPVWGGHLLRPRPDATIVAAAWPGKPSSNVPLFSLTHAFLI